MPQPKNVQPRLGPEHFPALPTAKNSGNSNKVPRKYTKESLAQIVAAANARGIAKPALGDDCAIARAKPLTECQLLKPFPM